MRAEPGKVRTQAAESFFIIPQRTELELLAAPTPVTLPTIMWVELIGIPRKLADRITQEALISAAKPCIVFSLVIENPTVLMILTPPEAVPRPMVRAHAKITHKGTL